VDVPAARSRRADVASLIALLAALAVSGLTAINPMAGVAGAAITILVAGARAQRWLLAWRQQIALLVLVIIFIPIKRYVIGGGLPLDLEPYRILVALMLAAWGVALLIDPRIRLRKTKFEAPLILITIACIGSELANTQRIAHLDVQSEVIKGLMFLGSFFLITYLIVSVTKTRADIERLIEVLCAAGAVLGIFTVVEYRTGYNFFDHLHKLMPFLARVAPEGLGIARGGDHRVFASAQHPIALGALFVVLVPLSIYLATRPGKKIWWIVAAAVTIGAISSVSRTSMVMFAGAGLVFLALRPRQTLKAWPLIVPAVVVIQFAVPGALRSLESSFFPKGGLIAQQSAHATWSSKNRLSRISPTIKEWRSTNILVGEGYSTRQPDRQPETFVLDNQWLKNLVETGILGFIGYLWLYFRAIRMLARQSRRSTVNGGWLEVALAAGIASFAAGMFFYDAFSFVQVTVIVYVVLAVVGSLEYLVEPAATAVPRLVPKTRPARLRGVGSEAARLAGARTEFP
jgi:O-Antigen ligase